MYIAIFNYITFLNSYNTNYIYNNSIIITISKEMIFWKYSQCQIVFIMSLNDFKI